LHTRLRAHRAPGIPRALFSEGAGPKSKPRANLCCEIVELCLNVIASEAKQSSFGAARKKLDCFVAEPVIGRRFAPTRWLLAMTAKS
jgi:hypothetical protein